MQAISKFGTHTHTHRHTQTHTYLYLFLARIILYTAVRQERGSNILNCFRFCALKERIESAWLALIDQWLALIDQRVVSGLL